MRRERLAPFLALALGLLLGGHALAHAELLTVDPPGNATVGAAPTAVTLTFSEQVEEGFSIFKAYRLDADVDMAAPDAWPRLNGLAGALVAEVLTARTDAGAQARVDTGLIGGAGRGAEVTLGLRDDLAPGLYVIMWRILSIDTHTTQGFSVFAYQPAD